MRVDTNPTTLIAKAPPCGGAFAMCALGAAYVDCVGTFGALGKLKVEGVPFLKLVKGNANQVLRVEKEILGLALAGDKAKAPIRKSLYCSCHACCYFSARNSDRCFLVF